NWPQKYRNSLLMCNIHGNRLNRDVPQRKGCGYTGRHAPDFLTSDNPWFRGVALAVGPEGAVYVTDWCDLGECHDDDGVHRSSGRIYRVAHGTPRRSGEPSRTGAARLAAPTGGLDLAKKSDAELVELQPHKNDWYVRHARRLLAE